MNHSLNTVRLIKSLLANTAKMSFIPQHVYVAARTMSETPAEMSVSERRAQQLALLNTLQIWDIVTVQTANLMARGAKQQSNKLFRIVGIQDSFGDTKQYFIQSLDDPHWVGKARANQPEDVEHGLLFCNGKLSLGDLQRLEAL